MKNRLWLYPFITTAVLIAGCTKTNDIVFPPINFNPAVTYGSLTDQEGNTYRTVEIGTQVWMAENLKTTLYNDGQSVACVTDTEEWANLSTPGYCWYNNDASVYRPAFGALYNWYAVNTGKLCPVGWHIPSNEEWIALRTFLGGEDFAGGKLKETGTTHWKTYDAAATNEFGFTALPGGERSCNGISDEGKFVGHGIDCCMWSATTFSISDPSMIWCFRINATSPRFWRNEIYATSGQSIRCIKD
jgi:uncharacterized protein (TIGR02145 family)